MPRIVAICREEMAAGFTLAGLEAVRVPDAAAAREALLAAAEDRENGLVIVDATLLGEIDERTRAGLLARNVPLIVPVPGRLRWQEAEQAEGDSAVAELIRRAVGYQLNIKL